MKRSSTENRSVLARRSGREKTTVLNDYRRSGLSLLGFARKHHLCYSTLIRWRKRFGQHAQNQRAPKAAGSPKFIPIHVAAEPVAGDAYVLGLSGGRSLKIPPGFETQSLRRLLTVLEAAQ